MTRADIIAACIEVVEEMRADWVPNPLTRYITSTGNMAFNALQYEIAGGKFYIGVNRNIAPYAKYTEYPWVSPYWGGKKNPNEGWWERFRAEFTRRLSAKIGGNVKGE